MNAIEAFKKTQLHTFGRLNIFPRKAGGFKTLSDTVFILKSFVRLGYKIIINDRFSSFNRSTIKVFISRAFFHEICHFPLKIPFPLHRLESISITERKSWNPAGRVIHCSFPLINGIYGGLAA